MEKRQSLPEMLKNCDPTILNKYASIIKLCFWKKVFKTFENDVTLFKCVAELHWAVMLTYG